MNSSHAQRQKDFYDTSFRKLATPGIEENIRRFYVQKLVSIIEENHLIRKGSKILEIGCGEGLVLQQLAAHFKDGFFQGIDISEKNIAMAKNRGLDVWVSDANRISLSEPVDVILGTAILHHLEDIPKFLKEVSSCLKEDGIIIFGAEPVYYEFFYFLYHKLRGSWEIEKGMMNISPGKIRRDLKKYYENIQIFHYGNPFVYSSSLFGSFWNATRLSGIPFLNDIYIFAKKKRETKL